MTDETSPHYKVVFVGDGQVGKTSLIYSYLKQDVNPLSTLGATSTRVQTQVDDLTVILNVWDTAGQESLRDLVPVYARGSNAAVIVFDLQNPNSYEHVQGWYDYIIRNVGEIVICLAANKSDLPEKVDYNEVFQWAADRQIEVTRTSGKEGKNVEVLFETIARELEKRAKQTKGNEKSEPGPKPVMIQQPSEKKDGMPRKVDCCN
jgi:Ras-related protein Rab-5C